MKPITFDIVTINYNGEKFIRESIESVLSQSYKNFRMIVQDGNSKDNSLEILNSFRSIDSRIHIASERDSGPADALNKALNRVEADYVLFLNSDDLLLPSSLEKLNLLLMSKPLTDIVIGSGNIVNELGVELREYYPFKFSRIMYAYGVSVPMHPATIFRTEFIKRNAISFNANNMSCWDGEFIVECSFCNPSITYTKNKIASFRVHSNSISSNLQNSNYVTDQKLIFLKIRGRNFRFYDHAFGLLLRTLFLGSMKLLAKMMIYK